MRISLKQAEITKAIAFYLTHARGLVADASLQIKYSTTRVGEHAGVSAEFDIEDGGESQAPKASGPAKRSAEAEPTPLAQTEPPVSDADQAVAAQTAQATHADPYGKTSGEVGVSEPQGGFTPAVETPAAADVAQEATSATGDEVLKAQAEDAAADAAEAQPDTSKGESLFN